MDQFTLLVETHKEEDDNLQQLLTLFKTPLTRQKYI